ncbi:MAG TPA: hypothetical protein VEO54_09295 [Thermoanaerobaculia bacterium]|nr:hypothetical protein [Thermoanaerobaculia bacterium]
MAEPEINYQQLAQQILTTIRAVPQQIGGFTFLPVGERRRLSMPANLPVAFLNHAAVAIDASQTLFVASGTSAQTLRDAILFRNALDVVADEMIMVGQGLKHTITLKLGGAGNAALRIYAISKTINRENDRELLIPHIENMRRTLGRVRGSSEVVVEEPPPQQQPGDTPGGGPKK